MVGAGPFIDPPLARTPFSVVKSRFVSNVHTTAPSFAEYAGTAPSFDGEKTMPGMAVTAENCAALQARFGLPQAGASGGAYQDLLARREIHGMQSARRRIVDVGHRDVGAIGVDRDTPLNAAEPAASAGAIAPDLSTLPVGIERVHDARLLTRDDQLTAVGQSGERGRRAEVEIGTRASATIHVAWRAAEHVGRPRRHLLRPPHLSRLQIERENRVSGRRGRTAVRVAGRDVQGAALDV